MFVLMRVHFEFPSQETNLLAMFELISSPEQLARSSALAHGLMSRPIMRATSEVA